MKKTFFLLVLAVSCSQSAWKIEKTENVQALIIQKWTHGAMIMSLHKMITVKYKDVTTAIEVSPELFQRYKTSDLVSLLLITEVNQKTGEKRYVLVKPSD